MNEVGRLYGNNIVFPGLGIDITTDNEAFSLFGLSIKWYGVLIAFGMLLAMIYCFKRTKAFGIDGDRLTDAVFAGLIGAVIGASPKENVIREVPAPDDVIVLLGGRTGRDGCGGATGSSKAHTESSIETCGAEVQKGNPPTERKIQRLFRNPNVAKLIKRCIWVMH